MPGHPSPPPFAFLQPRLHQPRGPKANLILLLHGFPHRQSYSTHHNYKNLSVLDPADFLSTILSSSIPGSLHSCLIISRVFPKSLLILLLRLPFILLSVLSLQNPEFPKYPLCLLCVFCLSLLLKHQPTRGRTCSRCIPAPSTGSHACRCKGHLTERGDAGGVSKKISMAGPGALK